MMEAICLSCIVQQRRCSIAVCRTVGDSGSRVVFKVGVVQLALR